jgi:hypothetical protein
VKITHRIVRSGKSMVRTGPPIKTFGGDGSRISYVDVGQFVIPACF